MLSSLEICAGAGGQALGLERAGFAHRALIEIDHHACNTLRINRPLWNVHQEDIADFCAKDYKDIDLFAGGVPCPPFSKAGKQLGQSDERDLFPQALRLIEECRPRAVMLENVRGLLDIVFDDYRAEISRRLDKLGYTPAWNLLHASEFGVSQLRPRVVMVAIKKELAVHFHWPEPIETPSPNVGNVLYDLIASNGWRDAARWCAGAQAIAPTIVGGSKKHGGPDLGPTRAKRAWASLGVDGGGIANEAPSESFMGVPKLTVRMVARLQGFPDDWQFSGGKTAAYRQVGNAFPPPVAHAVAAQIAVALSDTKTLYGPLKNGRVLQPRLLDKPKSSSKKQQNNVYTKPVSIP